MKESVQMTPADYYGEQVFNDRVMRTRLSRVTYESLRKTIDNGEPIDSRIADEVAAVMKQWAIEKGATHYTHWFMPMTNTTAEKHDAFIEQLSNGEVVMDFSGRALTMGEPDASSFPSGGLRETSRARGYTAWDCTSPAFVKEGTLYIPTAFFSYGGEILDKKAPLLRSTEALSAHGMRVLRALGYKDAKRIVSTIGPEQEYYLIDRAYYRKRPDLMLTGRTLFGAPSPKTFELDDHYFGILRTRVIDFMHDLDETLWRLGVSAKTRHNESSPAQHELAVIYSRAGEAADNNMLVMEMIQKVAERHGLAALLHERPFAGLSGSGKHINWSIATDDGRNILEPGNNPAANPIFLVFLAAIIAAVDRYSNAMRASVGTAANDLRLGEGEAPPAIISVFIGDELQALVDGLLSGKGYVPRDRSSTNLGVQTISLCTVDRTDRNRTSPVAFTGDKFEFRLCGSELNVAEPVFTINTAVAKTLSEAADRLEKADDPRLEATSYFIETIREHQRVIFNGDNYSPEWPAEAERRGLPNLSNAVEAIATMTNEENIALFEDMSVLTRAESESRQCISLDTYSKQVLIEARTALDMVTREITPAVVDYVANLTQITYQQRALNHTSGGLNKMLDRFNQLIDDVYEKIQTLRDAEAKARQLDDLMVQANLCLSEVRPALDSLRRSVDQIECLVPKNRWPYPSYTDMLFNS